MKMTKHLRILLILFLSLFTSPAQVQKLFTNDDVIKLAQAGFGDEVIQKAIQAHAPSFDISPEGLSALKKAGVSEKMIAAILDRQSQASTTPTPPTPIPAPTPPPSSAAPPIAAVKEVSSGSPDVPQGTGVFYKLDNKLVQMPMAPIAEPKGVGLKSIVKGHFIPVMPKAVSIFSGAESPVRLAGRPVFWVNNLGALGFERNARILRLKTKKDSRELEGRGKTLDISVELISDHLFKVTPNEDLKPGEYLLDFGFGGTAYDFGVARK